MDMSPLFPHLADILAENPDGLREIDLLKALEDRLVRPQTEAGREDDGELIRLFRQHFLLFHLLYRYRDYLREHALGDLNIFCLDIRYIAPDEAGHPEQAPRPGEGHMHGTGGQPGLPDSSVDGLRAYYLDWKNYEDADGPGVRRMIREGFAALFNASGPMEKEQERRAALELLGLADPLGPGEARKRYRKLAAIHHPDKGGNPAHFIRLTRALEILQS